MKLEYLYKSILLGVLLVPLSLIGQSTAERTITKSLEIDDSAELKIENQFGDIIVTGWDQETIEYQVYTQVNKNDLDDAEELLNRISIKEENFGPYVSLTTEISEQNQSFFSKLLSEVNIDLDKSDIEVNIEVKVPKNIDLNLTNQFGDIIILDWSGKLSSNLKHGDLKISEDIESLELEHDYGKVQFKDVDFADLELKNTELRGKNISDCKIKSFGSEMEVQTIENLRVNGNKDEYHIDQLGKVTGELKFCTAFIDNLDGDLNMEFWISDVRISKLTSESPKLIIEQRNSELDINVSDADFKLSAEMEGGSFKVPESIKDLNSEITDNKSNSRIITGSYGNASSGNVSIEGKKGYIILREI